MSHSQLSHTVPSGALAVLWVPLGVVMSLLILPCSNNVLQTFVVLWAWFGLQVIGNMLAALALERVFGAPCPRLAYFVDGVLVILRSIVTAIGIAAVTWPLLHLLPVGRADCW